MTGLKPLLLGLLLGLMNLSHAEGLGLESEQAIDESVQNIEFPSLQVQGESRKRALRPRRKKLTYMDRLKIRRAKLERKNEELMKKRIESMRLQAEINLMKKLNKALERQLKTI